jgi:hypothetical protein
MMTRTRDYPGTGHNHLGPASDSSGPVTAGVLRETGPLPALILAEYDARVETTGMPKQIHISHETAELCRCQVVLTHLVKRK